MPPNRPPAPPPDEPAEPAELVLDLDSFDWAERLECQKRFDNEWGDILKYLRALVNPGRAGAMPFRLFDRDTNLIVGDDVLPFLLWVQAKRDRPDAELTEFEGMAHADLQWAHLGGLLEKQKRAATGNAEPSRKRPSSRSGSTGP